MNMSRSRDTPEEKKNKANLIVDKTQRNGTDKKQHTDSDPLPVSQASTAR